MACWVEFTQLVEFFAEKLKPNRQLTAHREDIDNVAPTAPASFLLDCCDSLVAELGQRFAQLFQIDFIALTKRASRALQRIWRWEMRLETAFRCHDRP